jgi:hypothetical protein
MAKDPEQYWPLKQKDMPMPDVSVMFEAKSTYYMHTTLYAFSTGG